MALVCPVDDTLGADGRHVAIEAKVADLLLRMLLAEVSLLPIGCIVTTREGRAIRVRNHLLLRALLTRAHTSVLIQVLTSHVSTHLLL